MPKRSKGLQRGNDRARSNLLRSRADKGSHAGSFVGLIPCCIPGGLQLWSTKPSLLYCFLIPWSSCESVCSKANEVLKSGEVFASAGRERQEAEGRGANVFRKGMLRLWRYHLHYWMRMHIMQIFAWLKHVSMHIPVAMKVSSIPWTDYLHKYCMMPHTAES